MRAGGMIAVVLLALSFVLFIGLSPAYAAAASTSTVAVPLQVSAGISLPTVGMDTLVPTAMVSTTSHAIVPTVSVPTASVTAASPVANTVTVTPIVVATPITVTATSTVTGGACQQYLTGYIMPGQSNDVGQVDRLQVFLNAYEGAHLAMNGTYDAPTMAAVEAFQEKYASDILAPWGVTQPTGDVYITTTREINEVYCGFTQSFPLTAAEQAVISASHGSMSGTGAAMGTQSSSSSAATMNSEATAAAAIAQEMDSSDASSASSTEMGTSTSVTNNPLNTVGNFFKSIFSH